MRRPACAPPPKIWISGSGSTSASGSRWRHSGNPAAAAAAWAQAIDVATVALAPRCSNVAVPSSSARRSSMARWSPTSSPTSAPAIGPFTLPTASRHVEPTQAATAVASLDGFPAPRRGSCRCDRPAEGAARMHLHLHGRPATGVPDPAPPDLGDGHNAAAQRLRTPAIDGAGRCSNERALARVASWFAGSRYSTGDFPSTRPSSSAPTSSGRPLLHLAGLLPRDLLEIGRDETVVAVEEPVGRRRGPPALQQQVRRAEGEVERGIAPGGALRVEQHRPCGPNEHVLRADVAVEEHSPVGQVGGPHLRERRREVGVGTRRRVQVGLQPQGLEQLQVVEPGRHVGPVGGGGVHRADPSAELGRHGAIGPAVAQLGLPETVLPGIEVGHHQRAAVGVVGEQRGAQAGPHARGHLHPGRLVARALDRGVPGRRDLQRPERPLDAHRSGGQVDAPDVGGDATGQRRHRRDVVADEPLTAQDRDELGRWCGSRAGHAVSLRGAAVLSAGRQ